MTLNAAAIAGWSPKLADVVGQVLDAEEFPVVLGGDCSILLGPTLALKRRGSYGLLFIDGHADFYQPEADPTGEAASMELAFATGHGPRLLTDIDGQGPLVAEEDVFVFGYRDGEEQIRDGSQPLPPTIRALDFAAVRRMGIEAAATLAVEHLTRENLAGFFIHLDADCLDDDDHAGGRIPAARRAFPGRAQDHVAHCAEQRQGGRPRSHHLQSGPG